MPTAFSQVALTPVERFEAYPRIVFPTGTQQIDHRACFDVMASSFERLGQKKLEIQGFGCYLRYSQAPTRQLLTSFDDVLVRANYEKVSEVSENGRDTYQTWNTSGFVLLVHHISDASGLATYLTLVTNNESPTVNRMSPVDTLEFDPAVALPGTALLNKGSTCNKSTENVLSFIESMGRSTYGLDEHHCYLIYTDDWRSAMQEVMGSLEHANYQSRIFTADHLPISYQWWTHEVLQQRLAFVFAPEGTGRGLYIVAFRY